MQLCVALDLPNKEENLKLASVLKNQDIWLKVGLRSFIRDGGELLEQIHAISANFKIFLDLKIYDIPNTMADAAESIASLGVDMFNVHASSGTVAMQAVMKRLEKMKNRPLVLAVTALTSFDELSFAAIYEHGIAQKATQFAQDAYKSGLDGVVCSVFESNAIKQATSENFLTLTPGIRDEGDSVGDQKRVANVTTAKEQNSDFIVVGRPIYQSSDPLGVVHKIFEKMQ
ncbi:MAG: orotidine-5'-phosphate decarboxylase [Sulfurospirillum sp.]|nr:orotidine-5'-phosphate decarboxylase [Sulfurospirillum sp.]